MRFCAVPAVDSVVEFTLNLPYQYASGDAIQLNAAYALALSFIADLQKLLDIRVSRIPLTSIKLAPAVVGTTDAALTRLSFTILAADASLNEKTSAQYSSEFRAMLDDPTTAVWSGAVTGHTVPTTFRAESRESEFRRNPVFPAVTDASPAPVYE